TPRSGRLPAVAGRPPSADASNHVCGRFLSWGESCMSARPERSIHSSCSASPCVRSNGLMVARRWRESDEDDDAITARIPAKVDMNIGFPVVDGPNVASLVDDHRRLTHHWDKTGGSALTV